MDTNYFGVEMVEEEEYEEYIPEGYYFKDDLDGGHLIKKDKATMHYKNGREAKNGDKVVMQDYNGNLTVGILYDATTGNDYCNGRLARIAVNDPCPNLKDCLHMDDVVGAIKGSPIVGHLDTR